MIFRAPYPGMLYTLYTPNPELNDERQLTYQTFVKRTANNSLITYVAKNTLWQFNWQLSFSLAKMWEIYYFIREYGEGKIQVIDHRDKVIIGHFNTDTHDFTHERMNDFRSKLTDNLSGGETVIEELTTMQIVFTGEYL